MAEQKMPSKAEMAKAYAEGWWPPSVQPVAWNADRLNAETSYLAGFEAGFTRAVEMLRSQSADAFMFGPSVRRSDNQAMADWLERRAGENE